MKQKKTVKGASADKWDTHKIVLMKDEAKKKKHRYQVWIASRKTAQQLMTTVFVKKRAFTALANLFPIVENYEQIEKELEWVETGKQ